MRSVCKFQNSFPEIQDPEPQCDEHRCFIVVAKLFVGKVQRLGRVLAPQHHIFYQSLGSHHKKRSRNSFSRNIRDDNSQLILSNKEIIIKVSAHLTCSPHIAADLKGQSK